MEPAGKSLGMVPGMTTERAGTCPLYSTGVGPLTSMILVDAVNTTLAPSTASFSMRTPSTTMHREPIKQSSSMITGAACMVEYTAYSNATTEVNVFADLCT